MSYVCSSANYLWRTASVLGKGTFAIVFQGVSKQDGEPVAVKTFYQHSPQEALLREVEVLKKVKHKNIVKLLAIEEEQHGLGKVIIMELCTGGSLHTLLDDPENTYGLPEDDFLLVLSHLSAGMKHLRDNNIVHRDLKPGNIMKFIAEDGKVIFKLVDFGAARELEEGQEFFSLHGTEEYCHPDLYERAVLRKPISSGGKKAFSASVDLWSIGVTLYHVATGLLPFRPYGGRKDKEMLHFITTTKESEVISGCQLTENGEIEWKRELPTKCQISNGLKHLITPLLAGLMEVDESKRWTYDVFFNAVAQIIAKTRVHIFYLNKVQTLRVYMDPVPQRSPVSTMCRSSITSTFSSTAPVEISQTFQKLIQEQTKITPKNQIIFHKELNLEQVQFKFVLPPTSEENPVILCDKENINIVFDWDTKDLPIFPIFPNLPTVDLESDATLAKLSCAVGYSYKREIEKICLNVHVITLALETIVKIISPQLMAVCKVKIQNRVSPLEELYALLEQTQKTCVALKGLKEGRSENSSHNSEPEVHSHSTGTEDSLYSFYDNVGSALQELEGRLQAFLNPTWSVHAQDFGQNNNGQGSLEPPLNPCYSSMFENYYFTSDELPLLRNQSRNARSSAFPRSSQGQEQNARESQVNSTFNNNHKSSIDSCISWAGTKALTHVGKLRESWQQLLRDRATGSLTCNNEQFHNLERIKIQAKSKCLSKLLNEECRGVIVGLTEVLSDWYKLAQPVLVGTDMLAKDNNLMDTYVGSFLADMDVTVPDWETDMELVARILEESQERW